jgi:phosphoesterase RecJ-like protein
MTTDRAETGRAAVLDALRAARRLVLATHENPDGDALGSLVTMQEVLTTLGKDSAMFIAPADLPLPREYRFLSLDGLVREPPADVATRTVVFLDCGNVDRNPAAALRAGAQILNVDHHHDNTRFGDIDHVVPGASCTAEIVWDLMAELGVAVTRSIAEALYVALVTDTGRFMYGNTGRAAHLMAAALIDAGVDVHEMYRRLYEDVPQGKIALLARALGGIERFDSGRLTVSFLSRADFSDSAAEESDSEGIIDHLRAVDGTAVGALVRERPPGSGAAPAGTARKVSLRSTNGRVDVSRIARAQGGGGHRQAAGFQTALAPTELVAFLREAMAQQLAAEVS